MLAVACVLAALAALIHVYIFLLESILWTTDRARRIFGTSPEAAETTKELAFNQGFYNLFLAIVTAVGVVVLATGSTAVGAALMYAGSASMLLAALVLLVSSPSKARPAAVQGAFPLLTVVLLSVALAA